jgi:hypothetical protein
VVWCERYITGYDQISGLVATRAGVSSLNIQYRVCCGKLSLWGCVGVCCQVLGLFGLVVRCGESL